MIQYLYQILGLSLRNTNSQNPMRDNTLLEEGVSSAVLSTKKRMSCHF